MVRGRFSLLYPLATLLQESFTVLLRGRVRVGWVHAKRAAAGSGSGTLAVSLAPAFTSVAASPQRSPAYQAAIGFPGEPVAPTSLSGDHVNRNS